MVYIQRNDINLTCLYFSFSLVFWYTTQFITCSLHGSIIKCNWIHQFLFVVFGNGETYMVRIKPRLQGNQLFSWAYIFIIIFFLSLDGWHKRSTMKDTLTYITFPHPRVVHATRYPNQGSNLQSIRHLSFGQGPSDLVFLSYWVYLIA